MDEVAWLAATDPATMMEYARDAVSERKQRLVVCAAGRLVWDRLPDVARRAVEVGERMADGPVDGDERCDTDIDCYMFCNEMNTDPAPPQLSPEQRAVVSIAQQAVDSGYLFDPRIYLWTTMAVEAGVRSHLPGLFREVVGNPFRPVAVAPEWRTSDAVGVAEAIYAGRDYGALPVLADALEDAGCDHGELLSHLRGPGEHVRGCWALDAVLGRA